MSESIKWPTWNDGKKVLVGERAISLDGPLTITSIEIGDDFYRLHSFVTREELGDDEVFNFYYRGRGDHIDYIIDEGNFSRNDHPYREGEECDFWSMD